LTYIPTRIASLFDASRNEGSVSTASRNCRIHLQRLRAKGHNGSFPPGNKGPAPRTLRSVRLEWLNHLSGKPTGGAPHKGDTRAPCDLGLYKCRSSAKIAASLNQVSSLNHAPNTAKTLLEAMAGASPSFSYFNHSRGPPIPDIKNRFEQPRHPNEGLDLTAWYKAFR